MAARACGMAVAGVAGAPTAASRPAPVARAPGLCQGRAVSNPGQPHVVVVGGGIAGLAAAFFLREAPCRVTVLEGSPRPGGKLVWPGTTVARIWSRGRMCPLPRRQVLGVPADLTELAGTGLVSEDGMARARQDLGLPATGRDGDVPVAGFVAARFGPEVVDRLVDPLLAAVYAGRSEELSFDATLHALAAESRKHASLAEAATAVLPDPAGPGPAATPVFTTLAGGLGTLPAAVAAASGSCVRTGAMVRGLARTATGWRLTVGSAHDAEYLAADAVILAVPAAPAARLLGGVPGASAAMAALQEIRYASMAIVTLAYPAAAFPGPLEGSGYLVPAADLAAATGASGAPLATRVTRWGGGLPQYTVGHLDRVARIRSAVAAQPGLAVCGAAYDGIGIPACVATARAAAAQIAAHLSDDRQ